MPKASLVENPPLEETAVDAEATLPAESDLQERIAQRAYEIYCAEGNAEGCDVDHWLRAEAELCGPEDSVTE